MFERYTEPARRVLFVARYEASQLGAAAIEPEHVLLALIREAHGPGTRILAELGLSAEHVRRRIDRRAVFGAVVADSLPAPFSRSTQDALRAAAEEADRLGSRLIQPQHLLLALVLDESTTVGPLLIEHGLRPDTVRATLSRLGEQASAPWSPSTPDEVLEALSDIERLVARLAETSCQPVDAESIAGSIRDRLDVLRRSVENE